MLAGPYTINHHPEPIAMARAGRKRKPGPRHPGGQLKRLLDAERAASNVQKATVLAQPHRRGEESQLAGSALGRFVLRHRLRLEYFDAGESWASTKRKWLSARGAPLPDHPGGGTGGDVPIDVYDAWRDADRDAERAMVAAAGDLGRDAVRALAFDAIDLPASLPPQKAVQALAALAVHFGYLPPNAANVALPTPKRRRRVA